MGLVGTVPVAVHFCGVRPFRRIVLGFGFGVGLFLLDLVLDVVVGLSLKKQKATQPNIEEAVAIELKELREQQLAEAAQTA